MMEHANPALGGSAHNGYASLRDLNDPLCREDKAGIEGLEKYTGFEVTRFWNRRWEYPFFMHVYRACRPSNVLDAGAGKSLMPLWLSQQGCHVTALDIDDGSFYPPGALTNWYKSNNVAVAGGSVDFVQGDIQKTLLPNGVFDAVFSMSVLEHLPDPVAGLKECLRVARAGGVVAFTTDISLDGSRELKEEKLLEIERYMASVAERLLPARTVAIKEMVRTEWFKRHEPSALPWIPRRRSFKERAGNLARGRFSRLGAMDIGFDSMAVAGFAFRKRS